MLGMNPRSSVCYASTVPLSYIVFLETLEKSRCKSTGRWTDSLAQHTCPTAHRAVQDPISIRVIQLEGDCEVFEGLGQFMREIQRTHPKARHSRSVIPALRRQISMSSRPCCST